MTEEERLKLLLKTKRALTRKHAQYGSILDFTLYTFPEYQVGWHHKLLSSYLNKFISKEIKRLIICLPPRHGKSELTSRRLPALLHGLYPNDEILLASYNNSLASDMVVDVQRIVDSQKFKEIFPHVSITPDGSASRFARTKTEHEIVPYVDPEGIEFPFKGAMKGAGVGGTFTGLGANWCFLKGIDIQTDEGYSDISDLKVGQNVWTINHETGRREIKRISKVFKRRSSDIVRITTYQGRSFLCTSDHPFFVNKVGYRQASLLNEFDELLISFREKDCDKNAFHHRLLLLWKRIYKRSLRIGQIYKKKLQRTLLLEQMFKRSSQHKKQTLVCNLWNEDGKENKEVLQELSKERHSGERSKAISQCFSSYKNVNHIKRWLFMFTLWIKEKINSASYRSQQAEQLRRKLNNCLSKLSHYLSPKYKSDHVRKVQKISKGEVWVYDIQVEGNHNFFAQDVLVHNCLIDDPIKNREDADSLAFRESLYKWYNSTLRTRLEKDGSILITMTLWHQDDLVGRLTQLAKEDPNADQWVVLKLPAIKESDDNIEDQRKIGDSLWPEKFPIAEMLRTKASIGSREWSALYQQSPVSEGGNIIKTEWIKFYTSLPAKFDVIIQSWDFAVKDKATSDFTVGQVWGKIGADKYLIDQIRGRFDFPTACQKVVELSNKYPDCRKKLIEGKANGSAVIQTLRKHISGLVEIEPRGDKVARVHAVSPEFESGNVYLPEKSIAPWIGDFTSELLSFPTGTNDDQVDSMSQALDELISQERTIQPRIRFL